LGVTVDCFGWIETEKNRSRHEVRRLTSDVNEIYDLTIFLPGLGGESHPTSNLRKRSIGANSETKGWTSRNEQSEPRRSAIALVGQRQCSRRSGCRHPRLRQLNGLNTLGTWDGRQRQRTAVYKNWIFPRLEALNYQLPFGCRSLGIHVSRINSRVTERLREIPDVGKVDTKYQGGFAIACAART